MTIRLKLVRRQEERINKVKELMDMYSIKVPNSNSYNNYQPIGGSSLSSNLTPVVTFDPRIQKTKDLFQMFHLAR